ncbi:er hsp70 chaperone [Xylariales sp. AK1849]|nr:er hsp70 chaperone [Xylariales sp. AK1849]
MMAHQRRYTTRAIGLVLFGFIALFCCFGGHIRGHSRYDNSRNDNPINVKQGTIIGVDLGNTYSRVSCMKDGVVKVLEDEHGHRSTSSIFTFTDEGPLVGNFTRIQDTGGPQRTIFGTGKLLGRKWSDPAVQTAIQGLPYEVVNESDNPTIKVDINRKKETFSLEEITGMILGKLKAIAEAHTGEEVTHAVVTVPVDFNDIQRQAVVDAGKKGGLIVLRVTDEPVAVAIAYRLDQDRSERNVLVHDLGGTTLGVTLLVIEEGVIEVLASSSVSIGGENLNQKVVNHLVEWFNRKNDVDVASDQKAMAKLRFEVEKAKITLSYRHSACIYIKSFYNGIDFATTLPRWRFEDFNEELFQASLEPVQQVLTDANMSAADINDVLLVGGSSRTPKIARMLQKHLHRRLQPIQGIDPEEVVVIGAGTLAGVLGNEEPDEWFFVDVNPISFGIETTGGIMRKFIPQTTPIPCRKMQNLSTAADNQSTTLVRVFEGERSMVEHKRLLGSFELADIPIAPSGNPLVQISFELDVKTGNMANITIADTTGYATSATARENIHRILMTAEEHWEADEAIRERSHSRFDLASYASAARHLYVLLGLTRETISESRHRTILDAIARLHSWLDYNSDTATIEDFKQQKLELSHV